MQARQKRKGAGWYRTDYRVGLYCKQETEKQTKVIFALSLK